MLTMLAQASIEVFAVVLDRRILNNPPGDQEEIFRWAVARLVKKLVRRAPSIEIVFLTAVIQRSICAICSKRSFVKKFMACPSSMS